MYTSSDDADDGYYDNYISRALLCTGPVNQRDFTIQDALNIGLKPNHNSDGRGCFICPLGCLYVPAGHPQREEFHEALLTITNKGSHPIYVNLPFFELSPWKIHTIKRMYKEEESNTDYIIDILHTISLNHLPHEVETFVRNCDTTNNQYKWTLIDFFDRVRVSGVQLGHLDFFLELSASPEGWKRWQAKKQELLDELIAGDEYDPLDPSQRHLESRLRKGLLKDYVNYNDYNPFDTSDLPKHEPAKPKPAATYTPLDDVEDGYDDNCVSSALHRHVESRLQKELQKAVKDYVNYNEYDPCDTSEQQKLRKRKAPPPPPPHHLH